MSVSKKQFSADVGGRKLVIEISDLAGQANAAVLAKYGETVALVTVVMSKKDASVNYLPLKVDYEERFYAAGKIIGSRFVRREGRASEEAILAGRLVDRAIRPLFDQRVRRDIQVVVTILAIDEENDPDLVGLMGASVALAVSDVPWAGPVAGVRVAKIGGEFVVNPTASEARSETCSFETFVAGPSGAINMIEFVGKEISEEDALKAFALAQSEIDKLAEFEKKIVAAVGKKKADVALVSADPAVAAAAREFLAGTIEAAVYQKDKTEFQNKLGELRSELGRRLAASFSDVDPGAVDVLFEEAIDRLVHKNILENGKRPDGRALDEVRELQAEVGLFERTHGSAVFMRGTTHALAVTTLAPPGSEQLIETMETTAKRRFMLHYNFPPYSVGEIGSFRGPGRREIGHGALAEKALRHLIPAQDEFPYTIRVVSEIVSSNGSSSMATVCATALSLMDAGVPIKKHVAGIAMGLMSDASGRYKILTDIQGPEDHHGDTDLKVAGTDAGLTAIQMDVKLSGLTLEMLRAALAQAKKARLEILAFLKRAMPAPRPALSKYVPTIIQLKIPTEKIGAVIGPGGKVINGLIAKYGLTTIDIEEDGRVFIAAADKAKAEQAEAEVRALTREYKVGEIIEGNVVKTLDFGAIVDLGGGRDGMIHVSELRNGYVKTVQDVVKVGDFVRAKIIRADDDGRIGLSIKQLES